MIKKWWPLILLGGLILATSRNVIMKIKDGVKFDDYFTPQILKLRGVVSDVWQEYGLVPTITSSFRAGDPGLHGEGLAEDYRLFDVPRKISRFGLAREVSFRVGPSYQIIVEENYTRWYYRGGVFEGKKTVNNSVPLHMHGEFDALRLT